MDSDYVDVDDVVDEFVEKFVVDKENVMYNRSKVVFSMLVLFVMFMRIVLGKFNVSCDVVVFVVDCMYESVKDY